MCVAAAHADELPIPPKPSAVQEAPNEIGVKWKKGQYGLLDPETEVIYLKDAAEMRRVRKEHKVQPDRFGDMRGLSVLHRDKSGKWTARVYVVEGADADKTLEHERWHTRGWVHD